MPKVQAFNLPGVECWFWSNDHTPPHFHAKRKGEWEIRVCFLESADSMFELLWGEMPNSKQLRTIADAVEEYRNELLHEWETKVNQ